MSIERIAAAKGFSVQGRAALEQPNQISLQQVKETFLYTLPNLTMRVQNAFCKALQVNMVALDLYSGYILEGFRTAFHFGADRPGWHALNFDGNESNDEYSYLWMAKNFETADEFYKAAHKYLSTSKAMLAEYMKQLKENGED
jgi:hypothetical protein